MRTVADLDPLLRKTGEHVCVIGGVEIAFDLSQSHERRYAAALAGGVRYPQMDIDVRLFERFVQAGDAVLDLGANIGVTSLQALACGASRVTAVEPVLGLYERLSTLPDPRIASIRAAIGRMRGEGSLMLSQAHNQGSTMSAGVRNLFPHVFGDEPKVEVVPVTTIDTLGAHDVWKIDVEGQEVEALIGAEQTLAQAPPRAIIVEIFDLFLGPFTERLPDYQVRRAGLRRSDYMLELTIPGEFRRERYCDTSPMYVFAREFHDGIRGP